MVWLIMATFIWKHLLTTFRCAQNLPDFFINRSLFRESLFKFPKTCCYENLLCCQATGGQDKLLRVWVLKEACSYFIDMRHKYMYTEGGSFVMEYIVHGSKNQLDRNF